MKKEEKLKGGLEALLGGRPNTAEAPTTENGAGAMPEEEAAPPITEKLAEDEATPEEEEDLLNTIEDEELREALRQRRMLKRGRPRKDAAERQTEDEIYKRTTLIIRRDYLAKLKEICLRETITIKEAIDALVEDAIKLYEEQHGEVIPTTEKGDRAHEVFKK